MDGKLEQAYLYDFYGELLNAHQRSVYEDFYFNDLSLAEIAEIKGISRQGVHDLIRRSSKALKGYESRLHLLRRFLSVKERVEAIQALAQSGEEKGQEEIRTEIIRISNEILEEL